MSTIPGKMTTQEAASAIGVSHSMVTRYVAQGLLPSIRVGQTILIPARAVQRFRRPSEKKSKKS